MHDLLDNRDGDYAGLIDETFKLVQANDRTGVKRILQDRYFLGLKDGQTLREWKK